MNKKKVLSAIVLLIACMTLTSCSSTEGTYKSAQKLMSQGKFTKAAEKFASLGSYEDAANLAIYCKACALCEAGDFEQGIDALEGLNGYKDSKMRITYYTARSWDDGSKGTDMFEWMQRAIEIYEKNPLYLDSSERIAALNKQIEKVKSNLYQSAIKDAEDGNYFSARNTFKRLDKYKDSNDRYTYYGILLDEELLAADDQDAVIAVATRYTKMGNYLDCTNRAATLTAKADAIVADKYATIESLIGEEKFDEAEEKLAVFGTYGNERVLATYYAIAEARLAKGQCNEASASFKKAGSYSDAANRVGEPYYKQAEALLAKEKWDAASAAFVKAGSYSNAAKRVGEPYYRQAEALLAAGNVDGAITAFKNAGTYGNADSRWKILYYQKGERLASEKKWREATAAFFAAAGYKDALARGYAIAYEHMGWAKIADRNYTEKFYVLIIATHRNSARFYMRCIIEPRR